MKKEEPLVSVIVPNYNHEKYLPKRLDSILAQDYHNFEIIILDDYSSDNSRQIISRYRDNPKVTRVIFNDTNSGSPFRQWLKGISCAAGEIIWIAESDDFCRQGFLSKLIEAYLNHDCVVAFTRSVSVDTDGNETGICQKHFFHRDGHWQGRRFIRKYMSLGNRILNASSAIFSKKAAMNVDRRFIDFKESGDWLFWIDMARQGNVAVVSEPLNCFRRSPQTNTSKATLEGKTDIEDKAVFDYLRGQHLMTPLSAFNKQKRMAGRFLYKSSVFNNDAVRQKVMKAWNLPNFYFVIARISHLFHKLKR